MITSTLVDITQAILDLFDTNEEPLASVILALENEPAQQKPIDTVWCRLSHRPGIKQQITLGESPLFEQLGLSILQVFVPQDHGIAPGYDVVDLVDAQMKKWRSNDKQITVYSTEHKSYPSSKDSPHFQINYTLYWKSIRP